MVVRLAFAVVANTEPKILIVDEALAVGDTKFQARCMKRIRQLKEQGVTFYSFLMILPASKCYVNAQHL
jgi:lipopolysaccharide transport system ATP-binding protein